MCYLIKAAPAARWYDSPQTPIRGMGACGVAAFRARDSRGESVQFYGRGSVGAHEDTIMEHLIASCQARGTRGSERVTLNGVQQEGVVRQLSQPVSPDRTMGIRVEQEGVRGHSPCPPRADGA